MKNGASINERDNEGCTGLFRAVETYAERAVEVLLKAKADLNISNNKRLTVVKLISKKSYKNDDIKQLINEMFKKSSK